MNDFKGRVLALLGKLGVEKLEPEIYGNAKCFGKSKIFEKGFDHILFDGATASEIDLWERESQLKIPWEHRQFILQVNGVILGLGEISVYGVPKVQSHGSGNRQPFDLIEPNMLSKPYWLRPDSFIVGSCSSDGSYLVHRAISGGFYVARQHKRTGRQIEAFENLPEALEKIMLDTASPQRSGASLSS